MLTSRTVQIYGYVTIVVLLVLLCLVWFRLIDPSFNIPILILAALIIVSRVVLRSVVRRQENQKAEADTSRNDQ